MIFEGLLKFFRKKFRKKRVSRRKKRHKKIKKLKKSAKRINKRRTKKVKPKKGKSKKTAKKNQKKRKIFKYEKRKNLKKKSSKKIPKIKLDELGVITHYFPKVNAAVVKLKRTIRLGDPLLIKGNTTDFRQTVGSIQIDRKVIESASAGKEIGLEVLKEVRPGDKIFIVK